MKQPEYQNSYLLGLRRGVPIALGYLSVSFGFGLSVVRDGLSAIWAVLISMTNLTSAGQVAGVAVLLSQGPLIEMVLTELVINLRYSLMGIALTQKLGRFPLFHRLLMAFGITDEVFAVAIAEPGVLGPRYFYGLMTLPYLGWAAGTALGALAGDILPAAVTGALGLAIYSMFVAIVVPESRDDRGILFAVLIACTLSCALYYLPCFAFMTRGFSIIVCAVVASVVMAILRPVPEEPEEVAA